MYFVFLVHLTLNSAVLSHLYNNICSFVMIPVIAFCVNKFDANFTKIIVAIDDFEAY